MGRVVVVGIAVTLRADPDGGCGRFPGLSGDEARQNRTDIY